MARVKIGEVSALERFPVKSMMGEQPRKFEVGIGGVIGDRAYALREVATDRIASAKKWIKLFDCSARYESEPRPGVLPPVRIELPGGTALHAEDANASDLISEAMNRKFRLERANSAAAELAGIDPKTVFGEVEVGKIFPGLTSETMPDHFALWRGTFFDTATMHVIATGTLAHLRKLAPGSDFDPRRFRANIVVDTGSADDHFIEDDWIGGTLAIGDVRIVSIQAALRCVMTTHSQQGLPRDPATLRTAAAHHKANAGVFASVGASGAVGIGDAVYLEK
ncbi:MAG: MOSC domain-containing protein [Candidatus Binataceae bacterium]